jgi:hypothetical protein
MTAAVEDIPVETEKPSQEDVSAEAAMAVGGKADAATTDATEALRWFEIVEVEEVGFKAFCRLPNDFQHREIRQKAQAAKGRRLRQLRHADTDAHEALEADLDELLEREDAKEAMVGELLAEKFFEDRREAILDCQERDEFEHIEHDQKRYLELESKPDERSDDEWKEILDHLAEYGQAIQARQEEIQKPRRESLEALDEPTLIDMVRKLTRRLSPRSAWPSRPWSRRSPLSQRETPSGRCVA